MQNSKSSELDKSELDNVIELYRRGEFSNVIEKTLALQKSHPYSFHAWNLYALACASLNMIGEAQKGFEQSIELNPKNPDVYNNLGVLFQKKNNHLAALESYEKALKLDENNFNVLNNVGNLYQLTNNYSEAVKFHIKALKINPYFLQGHIDLGVAHHKIGNLSKAILAYKKAQKIEPNNPIIYNNIGLTLLAQKELDMAISAFEKAIELKNSFAEAVNNLGFVLNLQFKHCEAVAFLEKAISIKPSYAEPYKNLGNAFLNLRRFKEAITALEKAIQINKNDDASFVILGTINKEIMQYEEAIRNFDKALRINPKSAEALNNKGIALRLKGNFNAALDCYSRAITLKPNYAEAYNNLGNLHVAMGDFKKSKKFYQNAIQANPTFASAHYNLSKIKAYNKDDDDLKKMLKIFEKSNPKSEDYHDICFALAKAYEDINSFKKSFTFLKKANSAKKNLMRYNIEADFLNFEKIKDTAKLLKGQSFKPTDTNMILKPIFIVGMPRSGTTLVEQIISCHSCTEGGGELPFVDKYGSSLSMGKTYPTNEKLDNFRSTYLEELVALSKEKKYITDKMPQNFLYLALIFSTIPEAYVVHVHRSPGAVCWSNFRHNFSQYGLGYSYDLEDIVKYYKLYFDLMHFWRTNFEGKIYDLNYEKLVSNQERETKKLLSHIGLDWEEGCLKPEKNKRYISTNSDYQIRKEVYRGSSKAWLNYKGFLSGAFDNLPRYDHPNGS